VPAVFCGTSVFASGEKRCLVQSAVLIAFHKPYGYLSQFTPEPGSKWRTLSEFGLPPRVYPIGRLDADSEGLLLLSDEAELNARLLHPSRGHMRTYWAQVERIPSTAAFSALETGVLLGGRRTLPCKARLLEPQPVVPPRDPPVRFRKTVPDCWIALELVEGKYHQVRKMTASVGHPTLRLIRMAIGGFPLGQLPSGEWRVLDDEARKRVMQG
jgi:23S rRNA pseudouridine2457 synthase